MDEHELLTRLKTRIGPDLAPVRPLAAPGLRALWLLATWILLGVTVLLALGLRQDADAVGPWQSVLLSLVEVAASFALVRAGLRSSIPGSSGSQWTAFAWMAVALCLHLLTSWVMLDRSDLSPPRGQEFSDGLRCLVSIAALAAAPFVLAAVLLTRGVLTWHLLPFALIAFASGLAAEATWRLHCPYSAWSHVLPFHSGALLLFVLVASVGARFVRRSG